MFYGTLRNGIGVSFKYSHGLLSQCNVSSRVSVKLVCYYSQNAQESHPSESKISHDIPINGRFKYMINFVKKKYPEVETITTSTFSDWLNRGSKTVDEEGRPRKLIVFDVRLPAEYDVSRITPSAIYLHPECRDMNHVKNLIIKQMENSTGDDSSDSPVAAVMYCAVGYRASVMVDRFQKALADPKDEPKDFGKLLPKLKTYNLEGSIVKWSIENRALFDKSGQHTEYVHPFSRLWGFVMGVDRKKWKL